MNLIFIIIAIIFVWILALFYLRQVWFYRDPLRIPPKEKKVVVSPADGQIVYIKNVKDNQIISRKNDEPIAVKEITKADLGFGSGVILGIYMSPLDVHYNYAPIGGQVKKVVHTQAKINLPMVDLWEYLRLVYLRRLVNLFSKKFHFVNERNTLVLEGDLRVGIVEIADKFVNKIKCFVTEGENLRIGQKIGFVDRGSQVDLIIPDERLKLLVRPGQQVYGGISVIATYE